MNRIIKIFLIIFLFEGYAVAEDPRAIELFKEVRCLVCQGQTIHESNAELAEDIKKLIREKISKGETDRQIKEYLVDRYGDWILMTPPFSSLTYILWSFPFLIMIIGAITIYRQKR
jgi:cytochrome c-type biogenesis protein CcmH